MTNPKANILLEGGAAGSDFARVREVLAGESVVKVLAGNRYEHFRRTGRTTLHEGVPLEIFEWSGNTFVAE
ncbi:hypothetical protein GCM10009639_13130 [Kitasatospora putterlickiae]|uniref:Uncharacterized protein n=1 Tax=Kitasatospora putterlickiae TaxID=221725 RepID=A0ABN1XR82_9ACTN